MRLTRALPASCLTLAAVLAPLLSCAKLTEPPREEMPIKPASQAATRPTKRARRRRAPHHRPADLRRHPQILHAGGAERRRPAADPNAKLVMKDLVVGKGAEAKAGDKVKVQYVGKLTNGTEFDASRKHGNDGFTFPLGAGRVIKGWDQGVAGMKVGGKRHLTIPPELGYGARGAGGSIPPNSTLEFDVELVEIVKK